MSLSIRMTRPSHDSSPRPSLTPRPWASRRRGDACACRASSRRARIARSPLNSGGWTRPSARRRTRATCRCSRRPAAGGTVDEPAVVETFEAIATKLGMATLGGGGERLFGGHSLRATGARWSCHRREVASAVRAPHRYHPTRSAMGLDGCAPVRRRRPFGARHRSVPRGVHRPRSAVRVRWQSDTACRST